MNVTLRVEGNPPHPQPPSEPGRSGAHSGPVGLPSLDSGLTLELEELGAMLFLETRVRFLRCGC